MPREGVDNDGACSTRLAGNQRGLAPGRRGKAAAEGPLGSQHSCDDHSPRARRKMCVCLAANSIGSGRHAGAKPTLQRCHGAVSRVMDLASEYGRAGPDSATCW